MSLGLTTSDNNRSLAKSSSMMEMTVSLVVPSVIPLGRLVNVSFTDSPSSSSES